MELLYCDGAAAPAITCYSFLTSAFPLVQSPLPGLCSAFVYDVLLTLGKLLQSGPHFLVVFVCCITLLLPRPPHLAWPPPPASLPCLLLAPPLPRPPFHAPLHAPLPRPPFPHPPPCPSPTPPSCVSPRMSPSMSLSPPPPLQQTMVSFSSPMLVPTMVTP